MKWLIFSLSLISIISSAEPDYTPEAREYHLKAAFLRYVAKFVQWPAASLPEDSVNLCVLGQLPSFKGMDSINNKVVNDRKLMIKKILNVQESLNQCQMTFVANTEKSNLSAIIHTLQHHPILSFGDMDNFARLGGHMNFYTANNRLAIMINPIAVKNSNLSISPEMLKVVTIVPNLGK